MKERLFTRSYMFILAANFLLFFGFWLLIPILPFYLPYFLQPIGIGVCARIEITAIANKTIRTAAAIRINFRFIVSPHKKTEKGAIMAPLLS